MKVISENDLDIIELIKNKDKKQLILKQEELPNYSLSMVVFLKNEEVFLHYAIKKDEDVFILDMTSFDFKPKSVLDKEQKSFFKLLAVGFNKENIDKAGNLYYTEIYLKEQIKQENQKEMSHNEIKIFEDNGVKFEKLTCPSYFMSIVTAINYDDVQYCISFPRKSFVENKDYIVEEINKKKEELNWIKSNASHNIIKDISNFLKEKTQGDIYAMLGGGSQIQVFFGNESGYLGILYFPFDKKIQTNNKLSLTVNFKINNKYFKDFKYENVLIVFSDI